MKPKRRRLRTSRQPEHALLREIDRIGQQFGQTLAELADLGVSQGHEVPRPRFAQLKAEGMQLLGLFDQLRRQRIPLTDQQFRGATYWRDKATTIVNLADAVLAENQREFNRCLTRLRNDMLIGY